MITVVLNNKITVEGKEVTEVVLDFEKLTGKDLTEAENTVRALGDTTPSVFLSMKYQAVIAAKVIGVKADDVLAMNAVDFKKIVVPVASFLLG